MKYKLSKSTFIKGLQCEKSLYLHKHHYHLKDPISSSLQTTFDRGNNIGVFAQKLFPNGVDSSPVNRFKMVESVGKTLDYINNGESIIYEATFLYNDVISALDILVKDDEGWKAYEVKSSSKVTDTYIKDASIQYYTIINSGIELKDISIVHLNKNYTLRGELEIDQLFSVKSVLNEVLEFLPQIPNEIKRLKDVVDGSEIPQKDIGIHCLEPYHCNFKGTCWKHIPEYSVFDIFKLDKKKKFNLYNQGIVTLDQIDLDNTTLNSNQKLQVESEVEGKPHINKDEIKKFLNNLKHPLYFLDFETINPAIPKYQGMNPYQHVLFQYSLHVQQSENSKLLHKQYLGDPIKDPRKEFINKLIHDCESSGDILIYNMGFEKSRLNELIDQFPDHKFQLQSIIERLKDLMIIFKNKWLYKPEMKGSSSIKDVLTALLPKLSYNDLNIKDGGMASSIYLSMVNKTFKGDEISTKKDLIKYCWLDTYGMVKIMEKLKEYQFNNSKIDKSLTGSRKIYK